MNARTFGSLFLVGLVAVACTQSKEPSATVTERQTTASAGPQSPSSTASTGESTTSSDSSAASPDIDIPPEPTLVPVTAASDSTGNPSPMVENPTTAITRELSEAGPSRTDAESFALSFAQLQTDTRSPRDQPGMIDELVSGDVPSQLREFLLFDYETQRSLGTARYYDPEEEAWLRSEALGVDEAAPTRVNVELAGVLRSDPLKLRSGNKTRVDVIWEDDAWHVIDYSSFIFELTQGNGPGSLSDHLDGPGWRQVQ